jgi:hypothetical protein
LLFVGYLSFGKNQKQKLKKPPEKSDGLKKLIG